MIDLKRIKYGKMKKEKLTKNQQTVLSLLEQSNEPLKAYTILSGTQKKGIKAPTQVYRALDKLIEIGKVHKIESKNSYVACNISNCNAMTSTSFLICEKCEKVTEINIPKITKVLFAFKDKSGMSCKKYNLELFGLCKKCA